jgi:Protein of unknown function (DUF3078).
MVGLRKVLFRFFFSLSILILAPAYLFSQDTISIMVEEEEYLPIKIEEEDDYSPVEKEEMNNYLPAQEVPDSIYVDSNPKPLYELNIRTRLVKPEPNLNYPDTIILDNLPLSFVFEGKPLDEIKISSEVLTKSSLLSIDNMPRIFADNKGLGALRKRAYYYILYNRSDLIKYTHRDFPEEVEKIKEIEPTNLFQLLFAVEYDPQKTDAPTDKPGRFTPKRKYWFVNGSSKIQFSQNYISDTWYKGGADNLNLLSIQNLTINYKKDKIQFNNTLNWKVQLFNYIVEEAIEGSDKKKKTNQYRIGEELFRIFTDLGLQAIGNWSYSTNVEVKTQFLLNRPNKEVLSSFLSPLYVNLGVLGMKYNATKVFSEKTGKKIVVTASVSPFSVESIFVMNDSINVKRFKIEEGKKSKIELGSTINANIIMNFNKNTKLTSRFKFFTDYKNSNIIESENVLDMPLNRYFSTTLNFYLRYDDFATPRPAGGSKWGDFQLNELISFGFNYSW